MTLTLNKNDYLKLIEKTKIIPKIIETETEYEEYLAVAEELIAKRNNRSLEEKVFLGLILKLIEDYEEQTYSISDWSNISSQEILQHLMEFSGTTEADLVGVIGSSKMVSEIVKGQRNISEIEAQLLGDYFQVLPSLFKNK